MPPSTTREALIVEALDEVAGLIRQVESLVPAMDRSRDAIEAAHDGLLHELAAFDAHVVAVTEKTKVAAVKHVLARADEASRQSVELQTRAMADAARVAFGAEIGAAMQRLKAERRQDARAPWAAWLTHGAAAVCASAATWMVAMLLWAR